MRLYVPGAAGVGLDGWRSQSHDNAIFADVPVGVPFAEKVDAILENAPDSPVNLLAHSAGAVPAVLAVGTGRLQVLRLVLVEPALYDLARGHPAIERHISWLSEARALAAAGDLRGYWSAIRPLMFGGALDAADWPAERDRAERFYGMGVPWGSAVTADAICGIPTLVITGGWNDEYEAIAEVLVEKGARHERLMGARHRPQDLPEFEELVSAFEKESTTA